MLTQLVVWLNSLSNALGAILLAPIAWMPAWASATLMGIITGVMMLVVFKHTSNQPAIQRTRRQIKAHLLALSLFQDDLRVSLRTQGQLLVAAGKLLQLAMIPLLVMVAPTVLLLGQLGLWYQARPLRVGEDAIVTVQLAQHASEVLETLAMVPTAAVSVVTGPVRVQAKNMVCWNIRTKERGQYRLQFSSGSDIFEKELAVGDHFMPTSIKRPDWNWSDALLHPRERPFEPDSPVQSIEIAYPERSSWTSGTNSWVIYWFAVSMLSAFLVRPLLKVHI